MRVLCGGTAWIRLCALVHETATHTLKTISGLDLFSPFFAVLCSDLHAHISAQEGPPAISPMTASDSILCVDYEVVVVRTMTEIG